MSRVKHLFAVVLAALMLCLLMPVAAFAEEASDGKMIVYAKLPSDWSDPHLWAWADDGTNAFDAWPGGEMEADSNNDGWYYCWIPETTNNIIINANDAAVQTSDYKLESKNAWVTVTDAENVEISYDAQTTGDLPEYVEKFKIHAQVPDDWQDVCLWAWSAPDGKLYEPDRKEDGTFAFNENGEPYDYNGDGLVENLIADPQNDTNGWFHGLGDRGDDSSRYGYRYKDLGSLADFSQENQDVAAYLEQATLFWADMGVNGIRHDATLHMDAAFAKGLKDAVDSHNTITQFGEFFIGRPDPKYDEYVYFPKQTGINNLDFEFYRAASTTFGDFSTTMADFGNMLQYTQDDYDYENQAVTFLDNHDVTRFGYTQRSQKTYNAALATLLTSRGVPNIYYGTEQYVVPADGSDVSGRIFMQTDSSFDTDTTAYKLIGKLSELRQQNDAIAYGTTTIRYSNDDVLIYERKFYDDVILVAINRQPDKAYTIDNVETLLPEGEYVDFLGGMLNGENISVYASTGINTTASITLDGGEVGVWQYDAAASAPEIGNVVSTMGRAGNRVYIYGDGLDGNISVKFGETEATVESNTANEIVTYVPDNAVAGYNDITVTKGDAVSNSFTYNVLSGDQNQVIFHVKAETSYGENIYIVGNVPELGSWDPDKCTEALLNPNYPEWFLPVSVPAGTEIQFKFIKKDANGNVTWESGDNRVITSSSLSAGTVDTEVYTWRN